MACLRTTGALLLAMLVSGCGRVAGPTGPVDEVQPDFLDKMDLVPVEYAALTDGSGTDPSTLPSRLGVIEPPFYAQTTIIGSSAPGQFTGLPQSSVTSRIRFEVSENFLIAHEPWAGVGDIPTPSLFDPRVTDPVAVYHIDSHFDVARVHQASRDALVEDTTSRPWYQRRYLRVDWSQNLVDSYQSLLMSDEWSGSVQASPVPVYINNPADPNAPVFQYTGEGAQRSLAYFDVINRAVLQSPTANLGPGAPSMPLCGLMAPSGDATLPTVATPCAPVEVTFRQAFRRVDRARDYEPRAEYGPLASACSSVGECVGGTCDVASQQCIPDADSQFDPGRFGTLTTWPAPVPTHPILDVPGHPFAARHNLWQWHHELVLAPDSSTACNTDADCSTGSVCHIGYTPSDASHRGLCAAIGAAHAADASVDVRFACDTDSDCLQGNDGHGMSATATCDTASRTCQDRYVRCHADTDCTAADPNARCDLAVAYTRGDNMGECTLPYSQRQVRPIAFHLAGVYPASVLAASESTLRAWNDAFVRAIGAARVRECATRAHGGPLDGASIDDASAACDTPAVRGADATFAIVGCHGPVLGFDPSLPGHADPYDGHPLTQADLDAWHARGWDLPVCGPQGTVARLGDLRYDAIFARDDSQALGGWGLSNVAADPTTGEAIASHAVVWQNAIDARVAFDIARIRTTPPVATGADLWADPVLAAGSDASGASVQTLDAPLQAPGAIDRFDLARTGLPARMLPASTPLAAGPTLYSLDYEGHPGLLDQVFRGIQSARMLGDGTSAQARLATLIGSDLENSLVDANQLLLASPFAGSPASDALRHAASPLQGQSPRARDFTARARTGLSAWECDLPGDDDVGTIANLAISLTADPPLDPADPASSAVAFGGAPDASGRPTGQPWRFAGASGTPDYDLIARYATLWTHQSILAHELGHALGASHNLAGSADALNYDDGYWRGRGAGHVPHTVAGVNDHGIRPRFAYVNDPAEHNTLYSPEEFYAARVEDFATSSVMDVQPVGAGARGPGRYDRAFVAHTYVGMVEAFRRTASLDGALQYAANSAGRGATTPLDLRAWPDVHGLHYTQIPQLFGARADGTPDIADDNRYPVFVDETRSVAVTGWGLRPGATSNVTRDGAHPLVPYSFDDDTRAGTTWRSQRGDVGADAYESLHSVAARWLDGYVEDAFAHVGASLDPPAHAARAWERYEAPLRQAAAGLALDLIEYGSIFSGQPGWDRFANDPAERGGAVDQIALGLAADAFVAHLLMPEAGTHGFVTLPDGTRELGPAPGSLGGVAILAGDGRYFDSNWLNPGAQPSARLVRLGSFFDKTDAVVGLTDSDLLVYGANGPTDLALLQLGFCAIYPGQMIRLIGGVLADDDADVAPVVQLAPTAGGGHPIGRTHLPTLDGVHTGNGVDAGHATIDPRTGLSIALWVTAFSAALAPAPGDTTFADFARVWTDGSPEAPPASDPPAPSVAFTDPYTHEIYRALHESALSGPGARVGASATVHLALGAAADEAGIGARMVLHAQDLDAARTAALAAHDAAAASAAETALREFIARLATQHLVTRALFGPAAGLH